MIDDYMAPKEKPDPQGLDQTNNADEIAEPDFRPPEDYSSSQFSLEDEIGDAANDATGGEPPKKEFHPVKNNEHRQKFSLKSLTKKQWLIIAGVGVFLLLSGGVLAWNLGQKPKPTTEPVVQQKQEEPKAIEYTSELTGVKVTEAESKLPVTAIMIENSPDARPQSGLKDAGIVYEAVAEGGITRFLTLFQESQPGYIGPVRSVRPYYLDWLVPFDAPVAHVGGSPEALAQIREQGIKDLDYAFNSSYYHRISNRYAPHNVYTSRAELLALQRSKGWGTSTFTGWERKDEQASTKPTATSIDFSLSGFLYNPHYDYDKASNSYKRSEGGKPHVDEKSGKQISPKVVIAIVLPKSYHADGVHTVYGTSGKGKAYIFQDGTITVGTWEKKDRKGGMVFKLANGSVLKLNRGNTWVSAVESDSSVAYTQ